MSRNFESDMNLENAEIVEYIKNYKKVNEKNAHRLRVKSLYVTCVLMVLTSVDFWLNDASENSIFGNDIILKEVSAQMQDGSEYIVQSDEQKIIDWFYSRRQSVLCEGCSEEISW